jgi:hypothetical protein
MKKMVYIVEKCAKELCDYLDRTTVRGKWHTILNCISRWYFLYNLRFWKYSLSA